MIVEEVFFSIVVPVYNVQDYLEECVQSVLRQDFGDFELILVDDGSTDRSGALCDALALRDGRIRVLHQQNRGLSGARNHGTQLARGKYVLFLDSDDFYPQTNFLQEIWEKSKDADVVCFNYARYTDRLLPAMLDFPEDNSNPEELRLELVRRNGYISSACVKAVKRELLIHNAITFEEGVLSEDIEWSAKLLKTARSLALAPNCIYAYRVRAGSISHSVSQKHVDMQLRILKKLIAEPAEGSEAQQDAYNGYVAFQYCTILINMRLSKPPVSRETKQQIRELRWLLRYDANRIVKLISRVYRVLGFTLTSWLLLIYFKLFCK